jgi:hypothetical protein
MITRDKVYFSLAMVTCIIQATGLLVTLAGSVVDEGRGFYIFWISICIAVLLHGFILATSERDQKLTSRIEPIQEHCDRTKIKKGFA